MLSPKFVAPRTSHASACEPDSHLPLATLSTLKINVWWFLKMMIFIFLNSSNLELFESSSNRIQAEIWFRIRNSDARSISHSGLRCSVHFSFETLQSDQVRSMPIGILKGKNETLANLNRFRFFRRLCKTMSSRVIVWLTR